MIDPIHLFAALDASRYDVALPEGRISWSDSGGAQVLRASCEVILSYSTLDDSVVYGAENAQFRAAAVPSVPLDAVPVERRPPGPMTELAARDVARDLALARGAPLIYRCRFGATALYLALFALEILPDSEPAPSERMRDALARYIGLATAVAAEQLHIDPADKNARLTLAQLDRVLETHGAQLPESDADRVRAVVRRVETAEPAAIAQLANEATHWPQMDAVDTTSGPLEVVGH